MTQNTSWNIQQLIRSRIIKYWLTSGCGPIFVKQLLLASGFDFQTCQFKTPLSIEHFDALAKKLFKNKELATDLVVQQQLLLAEKYGIKIITIIDPEYPSDLANIYAPPSVLCVSGDVSLLRHASKLAIVGARAVTTYALSAINKVLPGLISPGIVTVSGGAIGVDTFVHKRTADFGGKTIVVLGSGILAPYPASNANFFKELAKNGSVIVSSFGLTESPAKHNFPIRNRIIAGLAKGCLVVQAAAKSGALITADFALSEGREVFAIPGPIDISDFEGSNNLLTQGATLVQKSQDILEQLGWSSVPEQVQETFIHGHLLDPASAEKTPCVNKVTLDPIVRLLAEKGPVEHEVIVSLLASSYEIVEEQLFNLELKGEVKQRFDGLWEATIS